MRSSTPCISMHSMHFVDPIDLEQKCRDALFDPERTLSPTNVYFWSHLAAWAIFDRQSRCAADSKGLDKKGCSRTLGLLDQVHRHNWIKSPRLYAHVDEIKKKNTTILTYFLRGTSTYKDVFVDATVHLPDDVFLRKVDRAIRSAKTRSSSSSALLHSTISKCAGEIVDNGWTVHRGMFVKAALIAVNVHKHLVSVTKKDEDTYFVRIHGHSLGGVCATLSYAWLRDVGVDVVAGVMSIPDFCDRRFRDAWLARHDSPETYRHYYTRGDPVVHALPKAVNLTASLTDAPFVCPPPPHVANRFLVLRSVVLHLVYMPGRFERVVKRDSKSVTTPSSSSIDIGCDLLRTDAVTKVDVVFGQRWIQAYLE